MARVRTVVMLAWFACCEVEGWLGRKRRRRVCKEVVVNETREMAAAGRLTVTRATQRRDCRISPPFCITSSRSISRKSSLWEVVLILAFSKSDVVVLGGLSHSFSLEIRCFEVVLILSLSSSLVSFWEVVLILSFFKSFYQTARKRGRFPHNKCRPIGLSILWKLVSERRERNSKRRKGEEK
ncbi:hypothetical protein C7M84_006423 [Penaeus vannamei]|uniref:Secreted protein n=1 Tax=Penaeus vannamei TaxID=6689 RepID=A0A3R7PKS0_PENVA|nr:hypothetical protein C7M84_006423 [Penaeus vannamei]